MRKRLGDVAPAADARGGARSTPLLATGCIAAAATQMGTFLGEPAPHGPKRKGYIMPAARRELRLARVPRAAVHAGPAPHANPGRRQQVLIMRRQQKKAAAAAAAAATAISADTHQKVRRVRKRARRSLMHDWKYAEAASDQLSPGAVRRLRARFVALLRTIQAQDEVTKRVPLRPRDANVGRVAPGAGGPVLPPRSGPVAKPKPAVAARPVSATTATAARLREASQGAPSRSSYSHAQPRGRSAAAAAAAAGPPPSDGGRAQSDDSIDEAAVAHAAAGEAEEEDTPFSAHSATDRELLAGWLRRPRPSEGRPSGEAVLSAERQRPRTLASCSRAIRGDAEAGVWLQPEGRQSEARRLQLHRHHGADVTDAAVGARAD